MSVNFFGYFTVFVQNTKLHHISGMSRMSGLFVFSVVVADNISINISVT